MQSVTVATEVKRESIFWWEKAFAVAGLLLSTGAFFPLWREGSGVAFNPVQGDIIMQGLWSGIYLVTFFLLFVRFRQVVSLAFKDKLLWLLVGLALVSVLWSEVPGITLRRSVALLGTTFFGIYLASCYSRQELLKLLIWTLGLSAVLSLGFTLLLPSLGLHHNFPHFGAMRGIYVNKNVLGRLMALAALAWLMYSLNNHKNHKERIVGLCFLGISAGIMFLSTSKTALAVFFILLFVFLIYLYRSGRRRNILPVLLIVLVAGSSGTMLANNLNLAATIPFHHNGLDPTLSGRTQLWQLVWDMIQQRPWLGYGYSAFWLNWTGPSGYIWSVIGWNPPDAHNFYLDMWLQLGLVGLAIFAVSLFSNLFKALAMIARRKNGFAGMFLLLLLAGMIMYGITDSSILIQNSIYWILYVVISLQLRTKHGEGKGEKA
ncbi:MAG: O-antigen ligase [Desulfotomaculaceae bacterium]|nr:O-antigen ligase [Desulfotomaculaceae bacterium]